MSEPLMRHRRLPATLDLLEALVAFDTSSRHSNLELIDFVRVYLRDHGIASSLTHDDTGRKANLYATIGRADRPGLCLSGHTDVVPADGQPWTVPAFRLTRREDRVLGRGTADMKGFLAAVLASVPRFLDACGERPIHLAFSYDEEVGCRGVRGLLRELQAAPVRPMACVIGEPTGMQVAVAHKGKRAWRCCVRGLAGHSALPHLAVNAVEYAAEFVAGLRRVARALREEGARDAAFIPPYSTVHAGRIHGGVALNVVADQAEVEFEIRNLPDDDAEAIAAQIRAEVDRSLSGEMRRIAPGAGFRWEELADYPGLADQPRAHWLQQLACELTGDERRTTLSFGTEGGLFQALGIPTIVCGPGFIADAHKADEFVELAQLSRCLAFLDEVATRLPELRPVPPGR